MGVAALCWFIIFGKKSAPQSCNVHSNSWFTFTSTWGSFQGVLRPILMGGEGRLWGERTDRRGTFRFKSGAACLASLWILMVCFLAPSIDYQCIPWHGEWLNRLICFQYFFFFKKNGSAVFEPPLIVGCSESKMSGWPDGQMQNLDGQMEIWALNWHGESGMSPRFHRRWLRLSSTRTPLPPHTDACNEYAQPLVA